MYFIIKHIRAKTAAKWIETCKNSIILGKLSFTVQKLPISRLAIFMLLAFQHAWDSIIVITY